MVDRGSQLIKGREAVAEESEPNRNAAKLLPVLAMVWVPTPVSPEVEAKVKVPLGVPALRSSSRNRIISYPNLMAWRPCILVKSVRAIKVSLRTKLELL